jgi:parvulin-like peptidyl-prolyl isomerase
MSANTQAARARRIALSLAGIVLVLAVAGIGLSWMRAPRQPAVPPGYAALVNGQSVLMSDFISETQTEVEKPFGETTATERTRVLHQMIDEELLVQRALALDLPETATEVRTALADAVNAQAAASALAAQPTEASLFAYYQKHRARYQSYGSMQLRDVVLHVGGFQDVEQTFSQAEADAIEAVYQLRSGASVDHVMEHFGFADSGRVGRGPELDFAAKLHLGPQLYPVAQRMSTGQVSDPIAAPDGVHVLVMEVRQPPAIEDFPTARAQVYSDYRQALVRQADQANLQMLRSRARILAAPGLPK